MLVVWHWIERVNSRFIFFSYYYTTSWLVNNKENIRKKNYSIYTAISMNWWCAQPICNDIAVCVWLLKIHLIILVFFVREKIVTYSRYKTHDLMFVSMWQENRRYFNPMSQLHSLSARRTCQIASKSPFVSSKSDAHNYHVQAVPRLSLHGLLGRGQIDFLDLKIGFKAQKLKFVKISRTLSV